MKKLCASAQTASISHSFRRHVQTLAERQALKSLPPVALRCVVRSTAAGSSACVVRCYLTRTTWLARLGDGIQAVRPDDVVLAQVMPVVTGTMLRIVKVERSYQ